MSCDAEYICRDCSHGFEQDFADRGIKPPICPCGSDDVLPADEFRENEAANAEEARAESWRLL